MENQNFIRPVTHEKRKRFLIVGIIGILVIGGTLAVWITRQQTQQRSKAAPSTTISFNPSSQTVGVNQTVNADIILNPGQNQISVLKLVMTYDANKFDKTNASLTPILASPDLDSQGFVQILESPVTDACTGTTCKMSVTLSIGTSPTKVITKPLKIATISLKAKEATDGSPAAIT